MINKTKDGKDFELDFSNSIPNNVWYFRINDNASSFNGGSFSRFSLPSHCDYLCFTGKTSRKLYAFELKSNAYKSIPMCDYELSICYENSKKEYEEYIINIKKNKTAEQKEYIKKLKEKYKNLENRCKSKSIKYHQIKNLYNDSLMGIESYFIFNFRNYDITYAINIIDFYDFWSNIDKKSINIDDIKKINHIVIPQSKIGKSKHWNYDLSVLDIE